MLENKTVFLNGQYLPLNEANISVLDRGFLFGDGIYEVIPSYLGQLFHFKAHFERLEASLQVIRLANPYSYEEWLALLMPLVDATKNEYIYVQITRGVAPKRDHGFPETSVPTVFAMCSPITVFQGRETGIKAVTMDDTRWQLCHAKTITLLANILHRQTALDAGAAEAILVKDGIVTEGAASNVFIVSEGVLITPPKNNAILPGITRDVIVNLAHETQLVCHEDFFTLAQLQAAEEIWVTSSTREIVPVIELDGVCVGKGCPGAVWIQMDAFFQAYKQSLQCFSPHLTSSTE